ncbi:DUF3806 domain-containing protein [Dysgonomonas sp. HDW5B]|uniref:DUF3806 domain-containing protein n=1 Tax=Dysgonomonas sp. HDW5B TaxID=2714927 RepID=UPI001408A06E|nr:DUF3806 domain-containing protein [Dysgonomonas sp. HDW5B]QIK55922.1 DUF3806 domain-containing protein [Dysgonomonas sp. HDW5B]
MTKQQDMSDDENFEHKSFEIERRTVEYKTKIVDKVEQDLINLSDKDKKFIAYSLVDAEILLTQLSPEKKLSNYSAQDLDELVYLWLHRRNRFKLVSEEEFVNAIGSAFGNCLNRAYGTKWTIISDEYGNDFSCVSENPVFQTFPFSSIWKAIEHNREGSLQAIMDLIRKHLDDGSFGS